MICHECAAAAAEQPAVALCRFCLVALCKPHLVELYRDAHTFPQFACRHQPARPFEVDQSGQPGHRAPTPQLARSAQRPQIQFAPSGI
jgi:hypothetical protein